MLMQINKYIDIYIETRIESTLESTIDDRKVYLNHCIFKADLVSFNLPRISFIS